MCITSDICCRHKCEPAAATSAVVEISRTVVDLWKLEGEERGFGEDVLLQPNMLHGRRVWMSASGWTLCLNKITLMMLFSSLTID
jgi:hypothetical protein